LQLAAGVTIPIRIRDKRALVFDLPATLLPSRQLAATVAPKSDSKARTPIDGSPCGRKGNSPGAARPTRRSGGHNPPNPPGSTSGPPVLPFDLGPPSKRSRLTSAVGRCDLSSSHFRRVSHAGFGAPLVLEQPDSATVGRRTSIMTSDFAAPGFAGPQSTTVRRGDSPLGRDAVASASASFSRRYSSTKDDAAPSQINQLRLLQSSVRP